MRAYPTILVVGAMCPCRKRPNRAGNVFFLAKSPDAPRTILSDHVWFAWWGLVGGLVRGNEEKGGRDTG